MWDRNMAVKLAMKMEAQASAADLHVALTGGVLYKDGPRKDADFIIYRHNTPESIDSKEDLAYRRAAFEKNLGIFYGIEIKAHYGYLTKAEWEGNKFDIMYPELRKPGEEYQNQEIGPVNAPAADDPYIIF